MGCFRSKRLLIPTTMRKIYTLSFFLIIAATANAQWSLGLNLEGRFKEITPDQAVNKYVHLGVLAKKNLTPTLNVVTGAGIRFFDYDIRTLSANSDLVTFYWDRDPEGFFYIVDGEYFRFTYISIPVGLEYKLTSFMRISYFLENNFLVKSSEEVDEYVQFGKDAIAPYMFNHNINISLHAGSAVGMGIGFMFRPGLLRNDLDYTYQFMSQYDQQVKDTYMFTVRFWGDFSFIKRKKAL